MRSKIAIAVIMLAFGVAGTAGAFTNGVIQVGSGDRVVVNKNLGCFVALGQIVCGGASQSRISAAIRSNGEIVIQVQPTPHGVYPKLFIKKAVCSSTSTCHLVYGSS